MINQSPDIIGFCPICGGRLTRLLLSIIKPDRFEVFLGISSEEYERKWVECETCHLAVNVYAKNVESRISSLSSGYYEVDFQAESISDKYLKVMSMSFEKSDNAQRVRRIRDFIQKRFSKNFSSHRKILDIGAGTGVFLSKFLSEESICGGIWSATAVEPDAVAANHLRSLNMFSVHECLLSNDGSFTGYDLTVLNKVLEHVSSPISFLENAVSTLNSTTGLLYVEVPSVDTIYFRPADDNILGSLHRHLYDIESLNIALKTVGLKVVSIERIYEPSGKISIVAFALNPSVSDKFSRGTYD